MSTCPKNDIHSIYLDGELPVQYVDAYESHVRSCAACQKRLRSLKALHAAFSADSAACSISLEEKQRGFERLKVRLSYAKTTRHAGFVHDISQTAKSTWKYVLTGAVAALVVALVLPLRFSRNPVELRAFEPVARKPLQSPVNTSVKMDGALESASLTLSLGTPEAIPAQASTVSTRQAALFPFLYSQEGGTEIIFVNASREVSDNTFRTNLASYDVFNPLLNMAESESLEYTKTVSFRFNSPFAYISFEIGSDK